MIINIIIVDLSKRADEWTVSAFKPPEINEAVMMRVSSARTGSMTLIRNTSSALNMRAVSRTSILSLSVEFWNKTMDCSANH